MRTRLRRLLRRGAGDGTPSTAGHELRYWQKTGLAKGTGIYARYLQLFELDPGSLRGRKVADVGCGPFGGVLTALEEIEAYPVDVLADEYNALGRSPWPILPVEDGRIPLEDGLCDACFCTNALDHVPDPADMSAELARILRTDGVLYLHLHLRRADQLNKAHRYVVTEEHVHDWLDPWFTFEAHGVDWDWPNDEPELTMLHATLRRRAPGAG